VDDSALHRLFRTLLRRVGNAPLTDGGSLTANESVAAKLSRNVIEYKTA